MYIMNITQLYNEPNQLQSVTGSDFAVEHSWSPFNECALIVKALLLLSVGSELMMPEIFIKEMKPLWLCNHCLWVCFDIGGYSGPPCWNVNRATSRLYQYAPFGCISTCVIHFRISLDFLLLIYLLMHLLQCFFCFFCIPFCSYKRN